MDSKEKNGCEFRCTRAVKAIRIVDKIMKGSHAFRSHVLWVSFQCPHVFFRVGVFDSAFRNFADDKPQFALFGPGQKV